MAVLLFFIVPLALLLILAAVFDLRRRRLSRSRDDISLDTARVNDMLQKNRYRTPEGGGGGM